MKKSWKQTAGIFILFFLSLLFRREASALGTPVKISTSANDVIYPQITTDASGYLHIVWQELTPDQAWSGFNPGIFYSRWNGDVWSAPLKISENTGFAEIPSIAVDSLNTVHAVWDDETYGSGLARVAYKTRSSTGTWSAIETLPAPEGADVDWNARVAIGASDTPNVVFSGIVFSGHAPIYWTQKTGGNWTTPTEVSSDASGTQLNDCQWTDLRNDATGNLYLTYWCFNEGVFYRKYTSGAWSTPFQITPGPLEYMKLAVTPAGQVFVTWFNPADSTVRVRWTQAGVWQNETTLATAGDRSFWGFPIMGVTTDSKERAHVGWGERNASNLIDIKYKSFVPGNGWGSVNDVDLDNNDADSPFIYPDLWDNQHFAWTEINPATGRWEIYYRVAEGTISTIPTTGGTITANPNNFTYATLQIPNGALSDSTQIGVQIGPVPETVSATQVTIPRAFTFRPHGLTFNSAATATVYYTDPELNGADERQLKPWFWNSQTNQWEARDGTVNRSANRIAVSLNGFSLYGISAPIFDQATFTSFEDGEIVNQGALPLGFRLKYKDGTDVMQPETATDLILAVKDISGNTLQTKYFEASGITATGNGIYRTTLVLPKSEYGNGRYKLEIYMTDVLVAEKSFIIDR